MRSKKHFSRPLRNLAASKLDAEPVSSVCRSGEVLRAVTMLRKIFIKTENVPLSRRMLVRLSNKETNHEKGRYMR